MSILVNSISHVCNRCCSIKTEGEIKIISSAYRIIWHPWKNETELLISSIYKANRIGERTEPCLLCCLYLFSVIFRKLAKTAFSSFLKCFQICLVLSDQDIIPSYCDTVFFHIPIVPNILMCLCLSDTIIIKTLLKSSTLLSSCSYIQNVSDRYGEFFYTLNFFVHLPLTVSKVSSQQDRGKSVTILKADALIIIVTCLNTSWLHNCGQQCCRT